MQTLQTENFPTRTFRSPGGFFLNASVHPTLADASRHTSPARILRPLRPIFPLPNAQLSAMKFHAKSKPSSYKVCPRPTFHN